MAINVTLFLTEVVNIIIAMDSYEFNSPADTVMVIIHQELVT